MNNLFGLRDYQEKAISSIESAWRDGVKSICYQLPTGGGKSVILRQIVDNHYSDKKTIYIIAHRKNLVKQLSRHIEGIGIKHGIIMSGHPYLKYRVQVCSIQTLISRIEKLPEAEIIIIDEVHHVVSNSYLKIFEKWPDAKILGVTATPRRLDNKGLDKVVQKLICGPPMRDLIDSKYLSEYTYYAPSDVDMSGVKKTGGDYNKKQMESQVDKIKITGCAVDHYKRLASGTQAIAACATIAHCEHVAQTFNDAGISAKAIHSKMTQVEIESCMDMLRSGELSVLCNCDLLGEGIDIPAVTTLIGLRPTASEVIFLQHIGRVLRRAPGKERAIILDHVGNYKRHGMPDDDREWDLKAKVRVKNVELSKYKRCPACQRANVLRTAKICPFCDWMFSDKIDNGRIPETVKGELIEITAKPIKQYTVFKIGDKVTIDARRRGEAEYIYLVNAKSIKQAIWIVYNIPTRKTTEIVKVIDYTGRVVWPKGA